MQGDNNNVITPAYVKAQRDARRVEQERANLQSEARANERKASTDNPPSGNENIEGVSVRTITSDDDAVTEEVSDVDS